MTAKIQSLLDSYPRTRSPLSKELEDFYVEIYKQSRNGKGLLYGLTQKLESWMHRKIAQYSNGAQVLEIGAGTFNHLSYEKNDVNYDVIEPFKDLFVNSPFAAKVQNIYADIAEIDVNKRYNRIISIAALEHIVNLPENIARSGLLLEKSGVFQAGIPSEGGFLWGVAWRSTVGVAFWLRTKLNYGDLMRHEHINDAQEIITLIKYMFQNVRVQWFPMPFRHLALYGYIEASNPVLENCKSVIQTYSSLRGKA